jgi:pyridinium-3,5-bisthiocarboxylic acid mononucleotide nickel chelatase
VSLVAWFDASAGVSGDMTLGALVDAGVPVAELAAPIHAALPGIELRPEATSRHGIGGTRVQVLTSDEPQPHRRLADVLELLAPLPPEIREPATATFTLLAEAEAAVHRSGVQDVHFHEVGALDAVADIVGACAGVAWLRAHRGVSRVLVGPVEAGSGGRVRAAHGYLPVPVPAVLELAQRAGLALTGRLPYEAATPTGVALLATLADAHGPLPALCPVATGNGAGGRDPAEAANLLRLVLGEPVSAAEPDGEAAVVVECNVDDLDPRLWPGVLAALLEAGAADAWLTPVLMKKGRPAHTLHALCPPERLAAIRRVIYTETSSIGLRETPVTKRPLRRSTHEVRVDGHPVGVKVSRLDGAVVHVSVEYEDVRRVAQATGQPAKVVLGTAQALAEHEYR